MAIVDNIYVIVGDVGAIAIATAVDIVAVVVAVVAVVVAIANTMISTTYPEGEGHSIAPTR